MFHSRAPGKLILTGEHAVVYGAPALAVAVASYTHIRFKPITESRTINTFFAGISSGHHYPLDIFERIKAELDKRFEQFRDGKLPIYHVVKQPDDLLIYTVSTLLKFLPAPGRTDLKSYLPMPGQLSGDSELPVGAGMGSSAAAIAATLVLYEHILDKPLSPEQRYRLVNTCERLQHGKSSGIDAAAVTYGGFVACEQGELTYPTLSLTPSWHRIFTGCPRASTGECVEHVRKQHGKDAALWQAFTDVARELTEHLQQGNERELMTLIRENHRLLCQIGVVPESVQRLVKRIEQAGGAAKISGAGSVTGEKGGMVIAYLPDDASAAHLARPFDIAPIAVDYDGAMFDPH